MLSKRSAIRYRFARIVLGAALVAGASVAVSTDVTSAQQMASPIEMPLPFTENPSTSLMADALPPSVRAVGASPGYETGLCMGSPACTSITRTSEGWWIDVGGPSVLFNHDTED